MKTLKVPCLPKPPEAFPSGMLAGSAPSEGKHAKLEVNFIECPILPVDVGIVAQESLPEAPPNVGALQVLVLATDRVDQVRARIGDGARWGLRVAVITETRELTPAEARSK